jgi:hypothetical protein
MFFILQVNPSKFYGREYCRQIVDRLFLEVKSECTNTLTIKQVDTKKEVLV